MLGSPHEAEDAVQETMLRAWRAFDRFEGRSAVRSWLFRIATNVCIEMLRGRKRRALPVDVADPADGRGQGRTGPPLPESTWVQPAPDGRMLPGTDDPAEQAVARESVRLAFVAALQHLSPRQRAVLILRDVLRWRAREVADLLETTVVSVNSALQRGRAALAAVSQAAEGPDGSEGPDHPLDDPTDPDTQAFLERYVDAFQRFDVERLVALLHEDVTFDMPPLDLWFRGIDTFARWADGADQLCRDARFVPVGTANGSPAYGFYHRDQGGDGGHELAGIHVVEVSGGRVVAAHAYLDPSLGPLFDLPSHLPPGVPDPDAGR
jgi:RNA polymerase sigma-70 factor (ECF subfamily)